jgi:hypothetical protein
MSGGTVTYNNGASGVGATLTISGSTLTAIDGVTLSTDDRIVIKDESTSAATLTISGSTLTAIDGVTLSTDDRIVIKDESTSAHNGIYTYTSSTVLTRATDFDTPTEMAGGDFVFVTRYII